MRGANRLLAPAVGAWLAAAGAGYGQSPVSSNTVITSDTLVFDYGQMTAVFEGHVVVIDPEVTLTASSMVVRFNADNDVESVVATGSVEVRQLDRTGLCEEAVYTARNGAIVMKGKGERKAELRRALDSLRGDEIQIYVNAQKVICTPGKLVIFPGTGGRSTGMNRLRVKP